MKSTKNERTIDYIPCTDLKQFDLKRVAVYARVSRESEEKHHSIESQRTNLEAYVNNHPGWLFVGSYIDEGVSGTKLNRPEFNRLLDDARNGKVDIILTKSVSRFGRNIAGVLNILKELQSLGVTVIFEADNISTSSPESLLSLQFLGIQAEAEAKQTSDYQRWSVRNRFKKGIPSYARPYGYQMIDHKLYIIPEEAKIVKRIFSMYLSGMGKQSICRQLNDEGIPSRNNTKWRENSIKSILTNEKYTGDMLLQKYYVVDFITKKEILNTGELPQYYIENTHEAIIDHATYDQAQIEIKRRAKLYGGMNKRKTANPPRLFTGLLRCGCCKKAMSYKPRKYNGLTYHRWICPYHDKFGSSACTNKYIREEILIKTTHEVLLSRQLITKNTPLTNDLLHFKLKRIVANPDQTLEYHLHTGEVVIVSWRHQSRSQSWTPAMKQKAKEHALKRTRKPKDQNTKKEVKDEHTKP